MKRFMVDWSEIKQTDASLVELAKHHVNTALLPLYRGLSRKSFYTAVDDLAKDSDFNALQGKRAGDSMREAYSSAWFGTVAAILLCGAVCVGAALSLALSVARPIGRAVGTVDEVKNLAGQTARATEEIGGQISQIQATTKDAVNAIRGITETIGEVSHIATSIASAVEEQGAATAEIARTVQETAFAAFQVTLNIGSVCNAANDTGAAAPQVLSAAGSVSQQAEQLSAEVADFVSEVRAA